MPEIAWLGIDIDMTYNTVKITSHRISINFNTIDQPKLSKLAGKIVSTKFRICDIIHLKTRFIYITMENRFSWDSTFNLAHQIKTAKEILFCKNVTKKLHKRVIKDYNVPSIIVIYSDASRL